MRLFLALVPSPTFREKLAVWQEEFSKKAPGCRPVAPDRLHMTLLFNGKAGEPDRKRLEEAGLKLMRRVGKGEIPLPSSRIFFDSRSLPGLGVLSFGPDLSDSLLWDDLREVLEEFGDGRPFWPHMTLFRRFSPDRTEIRPVSDIPDAGFSELVLFESIPEEARYLRLRQWPPESSPPT